MDTNSFFQQTAVYLGAAVVAVPISKRLGFGSVLGYLAAGIAIGPFALGLVGKEAGDVMHFAEFGVVMMLFLVGLELQPVRLWRLRGPIFGLGTAQVLITAAAVMAVALSLGLPWQSALAVGLTLALSSTALVLQTLQEKGLAKTRAGRYSFAVLLFQDIAVIPMLALFPLLALHEVHGPGDHHAAKTLLDGVHPAVRALVVLAAMAGIVAAGRFLASHIFRFIARSGLPEIFTASALLLVIGISLLMGQLGLSPALGAFLAGVVLSESEYRHELESDIAPFKGLLLGIFFIAVGASIDFAFLFGNIALVLGLVMGLMVLKALVLAALAKWRKFPLDQGVLFSLALAQAGEFGFVLTGFATSNGIIEGDTPRLLLSVIALSLAIAPLLFLLNEKVLQPRFGVRERSEAEADVIEEHNPVIIAGFGRFGHVVGRFLRTQKVPATVIEQDSEHVELLRRLGLKVYYGDATRVELLKSAGAGEARVLVIALDDEERSLQLLETARRHFPRMITLARALSRDHAYRLIKGGADHFYLEQQGSALELAVTALHTLGRREYSARRAARKFQCHESRAVHTLADHAEDQSSYIPMVRAAIEEIERSFAEDVNAIEADLGWDTTSLREKF